MKIILLPPSPLPYPLPPFLRFLVHANRIIPLFIHVQKSIECSQTIQLLTKLRFQCIVDTGDISKRVSADLHRVAHSTFNIHYKLIVERIKGHIQLKPKVFPHICTGIDDLDFLTHGNDGSAGFLFIGIYLSPDGYGKLLLI